MYTSTNRGAQPTTTQDPYYAHAATHWGNLSGIKNRPILFELSPIDLCTRPLKVKHRVDYAHWKIKKNSSTYTATSTNSTIVYDGANIRNVGGKKSENVLTTRICGVCVCVGVLAPRRRNDMIDAASVVRRVAAPVESRVEYSREQSRLFGVGARVVLDGGV